MKTYLNINSIQDKSIPGSKLEESYVSQENGKGLSTNDFTDVLKNKLLSLNNYDDSELNEKLLKLEQNLNSILGEGSTEAIENFNEIISFLSGIEDSESLDNIIAAIELQISDKQDKINDLQKIREGASKGETALQEIPEEYITEDELENKGYLTEHQDITPEILQNENEVAIKVGNNTSNYTTINYSKFSNDLTGRIEATPEEFAFRPSAGDKSIRDESALIKKIKGNTIVWNQIAQKDSYIAYNKQNASLSYSNDIATVTVLDITKKGHPIGAKLSYYAQTIIGHKYLFIAQIKSDVNMTFGVEINSSQTPFNEQTTSDFREYSCIETSNRSETACLITPQGYFEEGKNTYSFKKPQCFDLTQMFGAGNEPTTIEEFRKYYPDSYYPYCEPELRSITTKAIETVGFNQWDEQWEEGMYNINTGEKQESSVIQVRSKNYIKVLPNTDYFFDTPNDDTGWGWGIFYDEGKNFISSISIHHNIRTTPANASFATFHMNGSYGTTYKGDICINLSHSGVRNGEYQPYEKHTKDLSIIQKYFPDGMRSAGSICDEISFDEATQKWVAIQRVGSVDLGSLSWYVQGGYEEKGGFVVQVPRRAATQNIVTSIPYSRNFYWSNFDKLADNVIYTSPYSKVLFAKYTNYTDVTSFKSAISGVMLYYELAEPIITPIEEPLQLDYVVEDFGTEKAISTAMSAPFKADIIYQFNAVDRVRENSMNISKLSKKQTLLESDIDALEGEVETLSTEIDNITTEIEEIGENYQTTIDADAKYLKLSGGTLTGQVKTRELLPSANLSYNLGSSAYKYNDVFANRLRCNLLTDSGTANGSYSKVLGLYAYAGVRTGNSTYPFAYLTEFPTQAFTVNGETVYSYILAPNETLTYTYNGTERTVTNPNATYCSVFAIINGGDDFCGTTTIPLRKATVLEISGFSYSYFTQIEVIEEGIQGVVLYTWSKTLTHDFTSVKNILAFKRTASNDYSGNTSVASGYYSVASGNASIASGYSSVASGHNSVASGHYSVASGDSSVASGHNSVASGYYSVASGHNSVASHDSSKVFAAGGKSGRAHQTVLGYYNEGKSTTALEVGWGTSSARKNIFEVDTSGNVVSKGANTATKHVTSGGTSSQFVKGDGSLDSKTYLNVDAQTLTAAQKAQVADNLGGNTTNGLVRYVENSIPTNSFTVEDSSGAAHKYVFPIASDDEKNSATGGVLVTKSELDAIINEIYNLWYGIEWDVTVATTQCTRIGNSDLHKSLPIQNKMRGCILNDNGEVVQYLDDWLSATRDGSIGQVMVEIPAHYRKFETDGNIRRVKISENALPDFHLVPKVYISAYEATVQRSTTKLCSVVNTTTDYRGGNDNSSWDGTYRTLLGRPATNINLTNFRNYARKRNTSTTEWNCNDYNAYKTLFWLYYVEYANRNCQLAFNSEKDSNGYAQGGLGSGVTTLPDAQWSGYNSYYPFVPCGYTDSFGNNSGVLSYDLTQEDGTVLTTVSVNRYRGVELPFGHISKWTDGISIKISPTVENGGTGESEVYVANDTGNYNSTTYDGYEVVGLEARSNGYVKELVFGENGDIMSMSVGAGSTTYWADYHYTNISTAEALRGVLFGGNAHYGVAAGFASAYSNGTPLNSYAYIGSRLCFIPRARLQE